MYGSCALNCPFAHQQLHWTGARSLTRRISVFKESEMWICSGLS